MLPRIFEILAHGLCYEMTECHIELHLQIQYERDRDREKAGNESTYKSTCFCQYCLCHHLNMCQIWQYKSTHIHYICVCVCVRVLRSIIPTICDNWNEFKLFRFPSVYIYVYRSSFSQSKRQEWMNRLYTQERWVERWNESV